MVSAIIIVLLSLMHFPGVVGIVEANVTPEGLAFDPADTDPNPTVNCSSSKMFHKQAILDAIRSIFNPSVKADDALTAVVDLVDAAITEFSPYWESLMPPEAQSLLIDFANYFGPLLSTTIVTLWNSANNNNITIMGNTTIMVNTTAAKNATMVNTAVGNTTKANSTELSGLLTTGPFCLLLGFLETLLKNENPDASQDSTNEV